MSVTLTAGKNSAITLLRASIYSGEPLIFPTDTIYGIGAPISSVSANKRIYHIKKRALSQPMPILIGDWRQLSMIATDISADILTWLKNTWLTSNPVRYTVILKAATWLDTLYTENNSVAVRIPALPWLAEAISAIGTPVTATSVNVSGEPSLNNPDEIAANFFPDCKYMLRGEAGGVQASTIVDLTGGDLKVIRV